MLQRVADVITERANPDRDGGIEGEYAISLARHVIAAMRDLDHEADAEMLIRGHAMVPEMNPTQGDVQEAWEAMIDAALADPK